jgi:hypothetical protein
MAPSVKALEILVSLVLIGLASVVVAQDEDLSRTMRPVIRGRTLRCRR